VRRQRPGARRLRSALLVSAVLHVAIVTVFWASASMGREAAPLKVYAVNIVSPPPQEQGEPAEEQAPAEPEPAPAPQPAAQPEPPRPVQRETPPARREPSPAPRPTSRPAPAQTQRPEPARAQPRPTPEPTRPATPAPRPTPSRGADPSPTSAGGDNLAIRTEGAVCPSEAYCNNIAAMVQRYFRRPPDSYADRGDVCFRIARDGSVADLEVQRLRGSFQFRLALLEAVEQAGQRNSFGPLPRAFGSDWLPVCVGVSPQM
jgi:outer membrane biosynthesis protein TonB